MNSILGQLTGSTAYIGMEPHLYFSGLQHYPLGFNPATELNEVTGVFSGSQVTFTQYADYQLTLQNEIEWTSSGSSPDNDTTFFVSYRYALPYQSVLTDVNIGSIVRTIIESVSAELGILSGSQTGLYQLLQQIYYSGFISYASGSSLDLLSALLGVVRKAPTNSMGQITFTLTHTGSAVLIPKGTLVQTRSTSTDNPIQFATTSSLTIGSLTGSGTVGAEALVAGIIGNVGVGMITVLTNPISNINNVTNNLPFLAGSDSESDSDLRLRALSQLETLARATANSLKYSIMAQEGVSSVVISDLNRGPGTVDVIVLSTVLPMPYDLEQTILDTIDEYKAAGVSAHLLQPETEYINIDCQLQISHTPGVNSATVQNQVAQNITSYLNSLGLGDTVVFNRLIDQIMNVYGVTDVSLTSPSTNLPMDITQVARPGTLTFTIV